MQKENNLIIIKNSKIHGTGIYAKKNIKKGTQIIEYVGEKLTKKQADKRFQETLEKAEKDKSLGEVYLFELNKKYDIDGNVPHNTARWINHSCDPNCETEIVDGKEIWVTAKRDINKGEELSFNYGFGWEEHKDYPCNCGTEKCKGFMLDEELWPKLKNKKPKSSNK